MMEYIEYILLVALLVHTTMLVFVTKKIRSLFKRSEKFTVFLENKDVD